jgi:hypothetical protein
VSATALTGRTAVRTGSLIPGWRRRVAALALSVAAAGGAALVGTAGPAAATIADCTPPRNGFVNAANGTGGAVVRYFHVYDTTTSLQWRTVNGRQVGFAYLGGYTNPGDRVWMDWSTNGGRTWVQCGPFSASQHGQGVRTYGQRTDPSPAWVFRACSRLSGEERTRCTAWW